MTINNSRGTAGDKKNHTSQRSKFIDPKEASILKAARQLFLEKGFDAASMDTIANLANVSKRTVYNRFRSKEELFAASILDFCKTLLPTDINNINITMPLMDMLKTLSKQFLLSVINPEAIAIRRLAAFEANRTPSIGKSYLENGPQLMVKVSVPLLEKLIAHHKLAIDDAELAIWQLRNLLIDPLYTNIFMGNVPDNLEEKIDQQVEQGLKAFCKIYNIS